jgi:hypothetical protein
MASQSIEQRSRQVENHFDMNGRTIAGFLLALLLVGGAAAIGITAYNAGVTQGLVESGQVVVAPGQAVGPYVGGYGPGWGQGIGFFGFLGLLLFFLLLIGLLRAAFGGGRGRGGWGPGWGGPYGRYGRHGHWSWDERAREFHDELHRTSGQAGKDPADQQRS